ncbi:cupin domain-containing protein [Gracilibacillus sp. HCP3S3_G5_1]|uniref:cupin domain-containing protein n=1 Tax=unclassified Gracilibacillus TaxID=2625209 RepID=UPI003F89087A
MIIEQYAFNEEGMQKVYSNNDWMVGLKNWKPSNDIDGFNSLEKHNETDELFVLLEGGCNLVFGEESAGDWQFGNVRMEQGKVYNIPKGLWHNTITTKDAKLVLIEAPNTSMENSEIIELKGKQIEKLKELISND